MHTFNFPHYEYGVSLTYPRPSPKLQVYHLGYVSELTNYDQSGFWEPN